MPQVENEFGEWFEMNDMKIQKQIKNHVIGPTCTSVTKGHERRTVDA